MSEFRQIEHGDWDGNIFKRFDKQWMLVCVGNGEKTNLMTASWGGMGILWQRPVSFTFIRPQRFTRELIEQANRYSLLFFEEEYRSQLTICGTKSGRDIDKIKACGFTELTEDGVAYIRQASAVVFCRKLYIQDLELGGFIDPAISSTFYPDSDFHRLYVGEITKLLVK